MHACAIPVARVAAVVLAGGRGSRMGGVDKGLQNFQGQSLALTALQRLRQQSVGAPGLLAINANRNQTQYASFGVPVWSDTVPNYAGPLAGFLAALLQCQDHFDYLLCVPCDSPLFPLHLLQQLAQALVQEEADIAMPLAPEVQADGSVRLFAQPVFCLMRTSVRASLQEFVAGGGSKIGAWTATQRQTKVAFQGATEDPRAFANANTLDDLRHLETP